MCKRKQKEEEEEEKLNSRFVQQQWEHLRSILISDGKVNFPISRRRRRQQQQRTCMCVHEEQFTTRSVENLVEIVKNFNDTTGFIFSTAFRERRKSSSPFRVGALSQYHSAGQEN